MAIPENATKVHSWILIDVYQREQEMFDGSYKTFEKAVRPDGVYCIPIFGDKICMAHDRQPGIDPWVTLIGGRVDKWLNLEDTMKAELSEEWWITCDSLELYKSYTIPWKLEYQQHIYIARWCAIDHDPHLDTWWEDITLIYKSFDEFIDTCCTNNDLILFTNHLLKMKFYWGIEEFKNLLFNIN